MILSEIDIPRLDRAVRARGYRLEIGPPTFPPQVAAVLRRWHDGLAIDTAPVPQIAIARSRHELPAALDAGAADAVADPVDPEELAARLDARVRTHAPQPLRIGDLTIDPIDRSAKRGETRIPLVPREYALLRYLAERRGRFVTRDELLKCVWRLRFDPGTNVVAVHVSTLRAKLDRPFGTTMLRSHKGLGYCLDAG
ncbi:response regulator transcription factor [Sphingomonas sp. ST-64]|uniref:Response regulator transcription factor n=1 Tax=Sphingomonas plantiphila TaxID=3163295 RepID=A0ABW8YLT6_9SPHN